MAKNNRLVARRADVIINGGINNANNIAANTILEGFSFEFQRDSRNVVSFTGYDPVTGMSIAGDYTINNAGVVTEYGWSLGVPGTGSLFTYVELDGATSSFANHTAAFEYQVQTNPAFLSTLANSYATGNGQAFASAVDALPGANHYDPYSTGIGLGDGQYWFA